MQIRISRMGDVEVAQVAGPLVAVDFQAVALVVVEGVGSLKRGEGFFEACIIFYIQDIDFWVNPSNKA